MEPEDFAGIIAHLKGASLSTLMILFSLPQPVNEQALSLFSGYCIRSVKEGLRNLQLLDLVDYCENDEGWRPSERAISILQTLTASRQVSGEWQEDGKALVQGVKFFFPSSSSRSSIKSHDTDINKKLRQPPPKPPPKKRKSREQQASKLPVNVSIQQAYLLLVRTGIPNYQAEEAIASTVKAGWTGERILNSVKGWLAYAASEQGKTIKQPGFLIASRLKSLQDPPEVEEDAAEDEMNVKRYTSGRYGHLIKH